MRIPLPPPVWLLLERLERSGFAAYCVGGCVRDSLLGRQPTDWDIATSARPEQTANCFPEFSVVETGRKHGTITVLVEHQPFEVTTFRVDGAYTDNRRPDNVIFTGDLALDLSRRDFTVNAMAYHPRIGLVDPFHGAEDLQRRRIVCVGNPAARFGEDALRILRGVRFAAVLEFTVEPETAAAMAAAAPLLQAVAAERVRAELDKALLGPGAETAFAENPEVMAQVLPELAPCFGFDQHNRYHHLDVWQHTLGAVAAAPTDLLVRIALLFHDSGKPKCFIVDEQGAGHFYGHGKHSAELARAAMLRLRYDNDTRNRVERLVLYHDTEIPATATVVKRWLNRMGEADFRRLLAVQRADTMAHALWRVPQGIAELEAVEATLERVLQEAQCFQLRDLAVNGKDMMTLGVLQGQQVGAMLQTLLDRVLDDTLPNRREPLLQAAQRLLEGKEPPGS